MGAAAHTGPFWEAIADVTRSCGVLTGSRKRRFSGCTTASSPKLPMGYPAASVTGYGTEGARDGRAGARARQGEGIGEERAWVGSPAPAQGAGGHARARRAHQSRASLLGRRRGGQRRGAIKCDLRSSDRPGLDWTWLGGAAPALRGTAPGPHERVEAEARGAPPHQKCSEHGSAARLAKKAAAPAPLWGRRRGGGARQLGAAPGARRARAARTRRHSRARLARAAGHSRGPLPVLQE